MATHRHLANSNAAALLQQVHVGFTLCTPHEHQT